MAKNSTELIKEHWEDIANWYEDWGARLGERMLHSYINFPNFRNCDKILEVGCGPGHAIPIILRHAHDSATLYCTDLSESQVQKASSKNFPRTVCSVADNENLSDFGDAEFDLYISNLSLMIVNNPEKMLEEAYRVLKPNSMAIFTIWGSENLCSLMTINVDFQNS